MAVIAQLDGSRIDALALNPADWFALKNSEERKRLEMPLCGIRAVVKNRGTTQFFSHYRVTECGVDHGGESAQHQAMKEAIAHAVSLSPGWTAVIEHPHPSREWIIDVMAQSDDGRRRYVFEVQLSGQVPVEYQRRSQRYFDSGYFPVWLIPRHLEYSEVKIPTLMTGFIKASEIPADATELLVLPVIPGGFELEARTLGSALKELLECGHGWRHESPSTQAARLKAMREQQAREQEEANLRHVEFRSMVADMNRRTAPARAVFGDHVIRTEEGLHVRTAVTECWQRHCRMPMLIWHAWTPRDYWVKASRPSDIPKEVGPKRFENYPAVHRAVDRWMEAVDCDVQKADIDLRRTKAAGRTYSAYVCPACNSVCGQIFISILRQSKWSKIASPNGAP